MIDIHCHILPGVDDGPTHLEESIAMAKAAVAEGIRLIIATPHHDNGHYDNPRHTVLNKVNALNDVLRAESIGIEIVPGQEVRITGDLLTNYDAGKVLSLVDGRQYIMIELPSNHVPAYTKRILYDIQMEGLQPIIVHPERNLELVASPQLLYEFVKNGALTQITAGSIAGVFGKKIKKFSLQLIEANLTHYVASDAHNLINRKFHMVQAFDEIEKRFGVDMVYGFMDNAELLIQGDLAYREIPQEIESKKFLGLF